MGTNIPSTIPEFVNWCNTHGTLWSSNATQIGLTAAQATAFATLVLALNKANADAETARDNSKGATLTLSNAIDAARGLASIYISTIKNYAETSHNMNVYALGGVSPADPRSPAPSPVPPEQFTAGVNPDGSLTIKWKVAQPTGLFGVTYLISRRVNGGNGPFVYCGSEGSSKSFTDLALPVGVDKVEYIVQPKRGNDLGAQSNIFTVQFGSIAGGGEMQISGMTSTPHTEEMKIAA